MNGIVLIDKPKGLTSHGVVQKVKRLYGVSKAGHTGTLDPLATGVLAVCLGSATKLVQELMDGDKEYEALILLGVSTTSFDLEGEVTRRAPLPEDVSRKIDEVLPDFIGCVYQKPPYFSAVKYKGRPLYKWAREGRYIDVPARRVEVKSFVIKSFEKDTLMAHIVCSKGTYIRTLCHDLGEKLECGACLKGLRRIASGRFHINDAVAMDTLEGAGEDLSRYVIRV